MTRQILILPGDGIGPEIMQHVRRLLAVAVERHGLDAEVEEGIVGGAAIDAEGAPISEATLERARAADAVLLGAVGGPKWDALPTAQRPERGLLALRSHLGVFANLRPAILFEQLAEASSLKPELVAGLDLLILRELTGGIYFGEPRGIDVDEHGHRRGYNTYVYTEPEIRRIARMGFEAAQRRSGRLCSVDKANVLEVTALWREIVEDVAKDYPDVELSHMYVDNAAMQLVRAPKQFDVIVTGNMFGDILSDCAAMLTGSLGMLPSASLNESGQGLYEPVHGTAPDIAGQDLANPLATILSVAMMLRYSLEAPTLADALEGAVGDVLDAGLRTGDIVGSASEVRTVGTEAMTDAVIEAFSRRLAG
jgi:3-isopropylmalate dehydrogenase